MWFFIFMLSLVQVFATSSVSMFEKQYTETVYGAQCIAKCLEKYGSEDSSEMSAMLDVYRPYLCLTAGCRYCTAACDQPVSTARHCKKLCRRHSCREGCTYLHQLISSGTLYTEDGGDLKLTTPHIQCQYLMEDRPEDQAAFAYISWDVLNGSRAADIPLAFVLSNSDYIIGKTKSNLVPFNNLSPGGEYTVQVTAVSPNGVITPTVSSSLHIYDDGRGAQPPVDLQIESLGSSDKGVDIVVSWSPDNSLMSCFYSIYWMSTSIADQGNVRFEAPLAQWKYEIQNLAFGENYTVHIYSYGGNRNIQDESEAAIAWFVTPDCLTALNYDLSICSPPIPENFTAHLSPNISNATSAAVLLTWSSAGQYTTAYNYTLQYQLIPKLFSLEYPQPDSGSVTLSSDVFNYAIENLVADQLYKFYMSTESVGGSSSPAVATVFTGDTEAIKLDLGHSISSPVQDKRMNMKVVYAVVVVVTLLVMAGVVYGFRRFRRKSHREKVSMIELDYITDPPMTEKFDINLRCLIFEHQLGSGAFGKVMCATVREQAWLPPGLHGNMTVAVKMLKENADEEEKACLLKEMALMKDVGQHPSIVSMLACSTSPPFIVIDYCAKGDLKSYLLQMREQQNAEQIFSYGSDDTQALTGVTTDYADMPQTLSPSSYSAASVANMEGMFLSFARQIAFGMEYLAQKKFVHRDLAARNILVCEDGVVKIADFGLTRDVYEDSVYKKANGGKLPVKWMAIESIFDQLYTSQSDVWSFGVALWEITTIGGAPYPGIDTHQLLTLLKQGYRMEQPDNCTTQLYEIMKSCWLEVPASRPTFTQLVQQLDTILERCTSYLDVSAQT